MNIRSKQLSRRTALRGASVALALPFLEAMRPRSARAQAAVPKRLIYWFKPNGVYDQYFFPKKEGRGYDLPRLLKQFDDVPGLQNEISVLSNVAHLAKQSEPHSSGTTAMLTTYEIRAPHGVHVAGPSVDQVAANHLRSSGIVTPIHSLVLGGEEPKRVCGGNRSTGVYCSTVSWSAPKMPVPREHRPAEVFRQFTENLGDAPEPGVQRIWDKPVAQRSVLHYVNDDAKRLQLQLGSRDRAKLDEYLTSVDELDRQINGANRARSTCGALEPLAKADSYVEEHQQMVDLMVLALKCDLTRVITFMIGNGASSRQYRHIGLNSNYHPFSHHQGNPQKLEGYAKGSTYEVGLYANFVQRLREETDVDGNSLLHNSAVYMGTDVQSGMRHGTAKIATLVAGKGGGMLDTGKHVVYNGRQPMANVHTALLRTIGFNTNFGNGVTGPAAGLLA